jgi:hypothetical protein
VNFFVDPSALSWRIGIVPAVSLLSWVFCALSIWFSFDPTIPDEPRAFAVPILMISWLVLLVKAVSSALRRDWRIFVTRVIALTFSLLLVIEAHTVADYVHLIVMYPHYRLAIAGQAGPVNFDWGSFESFLDYPMVTDRILIYDASGRTARRAPGKQTDGDRTTSLLGNFFVEERDSGIR